MCIGRIIEIELKLLDSPAMFDDTRGSLMHFQIFILNIKRNHLQVITKNHHGIPQFTGSTFNLKPQIMQIHSKGSLIIKKNSFITVEIQKNLWVGGKTIGKPQLLNVKWPTFPFSLRYIKHGNGKFTIYFGDFPIQSSI
jgi:hypothetical protein